MPAFSLQRKDQACYNKLMVKKGDTLIEVTLAIGIFSMIAVGITAVMSSGTAGAQTALETTLTREEIDTQAEAIRFIQSAYAVDKDNANGRFASLWKEIKDNAIDNINQLENPAAILQFNPESCANAFGEDEVRKQVEEHAFVINPRKLGTFTASTDPTDNNGIFSVFISNSTEKLTQASIYPRTIYKDNLSPDAQESLIDTNGNILYRAEGLYVLAVKDSGESGNSGTTSIVDKYGVDKTSAYYDFYIRACWYGTDANTPSTISTVIRLYDPDIAQ